MTDHDTGWINNSGGNVLQYDFMPPRDWTSERIAAQQAAIAGLLAGLSATSPATLPAALSATVSASLPATVSAAVDTGAGEPGWMRLARRLPEGLRAALVAELRAGNRLTGIGSSGWPDEGSIVVNLRDRFTAARQLLPDGVTFRRIDDPRYAREEASQKLGAVEFLLITRPVRAAAFSSE